MDNIFVERLWRSLKYEEVYLNAYATVAEAKAGIGAWLDFYNTERQHQSLGYRTPPIVHISTGTTVNKTIDVDDSKSRGVAPATAPTMIGADIETGRATP